MAASFFYLCQFYVSSADTEFAIPKTVFQYSVIFASFLGIPCICQSYKQTEAVRLINKI